MSSTPNLHQGDGHRRGVVVVGRYVIRRKLGSGSMGTVYLATDGATAEPVALKIIRVERLISGALTRIQKEFKAFAALEHPQIAKAYDFGYTDGTGIPFYTREYVDGVPLPPGPPPDDRSPAEHLRPILDLLDAVSYLHENEILHLDIHAGNLLVASRPERGSVLIDFGLLPPEGGTRFSVADGLSALPPEMIRRGEVTARSDLFLAGRLLHYRLTGRTEGEARLPREIPGWGPRLTLDLERIIAKALQPSPEQRFQSAAEFLAALSGALGETRPRLGGESPPDVILGRDRELRAIEDALRVVLRGGSDVLWFTGRSGLGKSRLLREACQRAQLRGLQAILVEFSADSASGPALLSTLRAQRAKSRRVPDHDWLEPVEIRHGGTPEERARRAADAYFSEHGDPLVLLLDDLDRADLESRSLAEALVAEALRRRSRDPGGRGLGIVIAGSLRAASETSYGALSGLLEKEGVGDSLFHHLEPLPKAASQRLVRALSRPLAPSDELLEQAARQAEGIPLYLRQVAMALKVEWGESGVIPPSVQLPVIAFRDAPSPSGAPSIAAKSSPEDAAILEVLAVLDRPARRKEIQSAVGHRGHGVAAVSRHLRQLVRLEIVWASDRGAHRRYRLSEPEAARQFAACVSAERVREMHRRVAECLEKEARPSPVDQENLAAHLLALGRLREAQDVAYEAAGRWRESGSYDRAIRLLESVSRGETDTRRRLWIAEEMSTICGENGDHQRGIAVMEPFVSEAMEGLTDGERVRAGRRLGVHCQRAGAVEKALSVFESIRRKADPSRDLEDLIFIDTELGVVHIFLGRYEEAEEACRRGLARLDQLDALDTFRQRMEVVLRASVGHLGLRRMDLDLARTELLSASKLAERHGTTAERASILNNLGITANQLNRFEEGRGHFERAERLLLEAGERRSIIEIATNLAVIAAKTGDRDEARLHVERATKMVERYPGKRIEFFVAYSRGIVHQLFGEVDAAIEALEEALALGRQLGDAFLVGFGEIYLAEACLAAGRYGASWRQLRSTLGRSEGSGPTLLLRMVHSRLLLVESIFGRQRPAARSRRFLRETRRTDVTLLESWNDLFAGLAAVLQGASPDVSFDAARETFSRLGVPFGERFARLGALIEALSTGDPARIRTRLEEVGDGTRCRHALLAVAEPLVRAEAHFALDELAPAENWLRIANGAIVGSPFLELDWRIELLRARIALAARRARDARRHLHRVVHTRDLLLQLVPTRARGRFLAHARFDALREGALPITRSPRLEYSTERLKRTARYEGMVGRSSAMIRLFHVIEELREQEIPVLVTGETGTGKELVARAIHSRSPRHKGPFQALHCASLPENLFESELFGYEAGAFTGAVEDQPGLLESLEGGTLLLDEIGELALGLQSRLLQVLDSGYARRLGSVRRKRLDVRFLASTSRDLSRDVASGRFRADLFYRLRGVHVALPPLRERRDDIADLARFFVERHAAQLERPVPRLAGEALEMMRNHDWPGNVREMETLLLRSVVNLSESETIRARDVAPYLGAPTRALFDRELLEAHDIHDLKQSLEREYLTHLFHRTRGNARKMMEALGVKRTQLYDWFQRLGIDVRELRKRL